MKKILLIVVVVLMAPLFALLIHFANVPQPRIVQPKQETQQVDATADTSSQTKVAKVKEETKQTDADIDVDRILNAISVACGNNIDMGTSSIKRLKEDIVLAAQNGLSIQEIVSSIERGLNQQNIMRTGGIGVTMSLQMSIEISLAVETVYKANTLAGNGNSFDKADISNRLIGGKTLSLNDERGQFRQFFILAVQSAVKDPQKRKEFEDRIIWASDEECKKMKKSFVNSKDPEERVVAERLNMIVSSYGYFSYGREARGLLFEENTDVQAQNAINKFADVRASSQYAFDMRRRLLRIKLDTSTKAGKEDEASREKLFNFISLNEKFIKGETLTKEEQKAYVGIENEIYTKGSELRDFVMLNGLKSGLDMISVLGHNAFNRNIKNKKKAIEIQ